MAQDALLGGRKEAYSPASGRGVTVGKVPALSITQVVEITAIINPSRALFVAHPFGLTFGAVGDTQAQRAVLSAMFKTAERMDTAGIQDSGLAWVHDDLRARQLRKQT